MRIGKLVIVIGNFGISFGKVEKEYIITNAGSH